MLDEQLETQKGCSGSTGVKNNRKPWLGAPTAAIRLKDF